jgi:hypothetical protein
MPSKVCLGKPGVCRLACVTFIYTSVSARYIIRSLEWQRIGNQIDTAFILAADFPKLAANKSNRFNFEFFAIWLVLMKKRQAIFAKQNAKKAQQENDHQVTRK